MPKLVDENHEQLAQKLGKALYEENVRKYMSLRKANHDLIFGMPHVSRKTLHERTFEIALELKQAKEKADG